MTSLTIKSSANPELNFSEITNLSSLTSVVLFLPVAPFIILKSFLVQFQRTAVAKLQNLLLIQLQTHNYLELSLHDQNLKDQQIEPFPLQIINH